MTIMCSDMFVLEYFAPCICFVYYIFSIVFHADLSHMMSGFF